MKPAETKFWSRLLWALVFPRRRQRIVPTVSGLLLIGLSFGLGTAAYNAANNILFITLALLLACLILSGVLSWLNVRDVTWALAVAAPCRVGQEAIVTLRLENGKKVLPTYGLWFDLTARPVRREPPARAETTFLGKDLDLRAILAAVDKTVVKGSVALQTRLDPGGATQLEWTFRPVARAGGGGDLFALRRYAEGDSHRLVHWKASARAGRLLVRQFAAERAEGFSLWVRTDAATWTRPEQFELMVGFAATLAEDVFRAGNLRGVALGAEAPMAVRRLRDVEAVIDRLAVAEVDGEGREAKGERPEAGGEGGRRNVITFRPDGPRGVVAWVDGEKLAAV